ncbi:hypothetical protein ABE28_021840 [Peribacillus muralis]|uniref:Uncharacterized protein n=1 Tax=Peribacillus muralis TaxID=264697 RepID=A0A1B3XUU4_9BACI|nr:hypothetical protein [Peribacillus muralis]AOH56997.1 hypothetical protein ABE28_021840 [Peribacillus muralis]
MNIKKTSKFKAYTCQIGMLAGELGALLARLACLLANLRTLLAKSSCLLAKLGFADEMNHFHQENQAFWTKMEQIS